MNDIISNKKVVTRNDFLSIQELTELSLKARKLLYFTIANCKMNDKKFLIYEVNTEELTKILNVEERSVYNTVKKIAKELAHFLICYEDDINEEFDYIPMFSRSSYKRGKMIIKINDDMKPYFLELKKNFTQAHLIDFVKMRSTYSMAVWHIFQREMRGTYPMIKQEIRFKLTLEELRQVTGTQKKFKQIGEFKTRVLDQAIKEISENCLSDIEYKNIKSSYKVVGFEFVARSPWRT